jgi:hypothetical protein
MTPTPPTVPPPRVAKPVRRVLHALISLAGWALFVYWWWIVFHRVSGHEIRFTVLFIGLSLAVIVLMTLGWAWHNLRIFRRRGNRKQIREATSDFARDGLGRPVDYPYREIDRHVAPVVYVRLVGDGKQYEPASQLPPRGSSPGGRNGRGSAP